MLNSILDKANIVQLKAIDCFHTYNKPYYYYACAINVISYATYNISILLNDYIENNHIEIKFLQYPLSYIKDICTIAFLSSAFALGVGIAKPDWIDNVITTYDSTLKYVQMKENKASLILEDVQEISVNSIYEIYDLLDENIKYIYDVASEMTITFAQEIEHVYNTLTPM